MLSNAIVRVHVKYYKSSLKKDCISSFVIEVSELVYINNIKPTNDYVLLRWALVSTSDQSFTWLWTPVQTTIVTDGNAFCRIVGELSFHLRRSRRLLLALAWNKHTDTIYIYNAQHPLML